MAAAKIGYGLSGLGIASGASELAKGKEGNTYTGAFDLATGIAGAYGSKKLAELGKAPAPKVLGEGRTGPVATPAVPPDPAPAAQPPAAPEASGSSSGGARGSAPSPTLGNQAAPAPAEGLGGGSPGAGAQAESASNPGPSSAGRVTSPDAAARRAVQGEYIDPRTNQVVNTTDPLAADHIVPQRVIKQLEGFDQLTPEQKSAVLNHAENFQGLPKSFNSSKGGKLPADWAEYKGEPIHPDYVNRNQALQPRLLDQLIEMIDSFKGGNSGAR